MSNSNTQLDLFHGVVLTMEQEQEMLLGLKNKLKEQLIVKQNVILY